MAYAVACLEASRPAQTGGQFITTCIGMQLYTLNQWIDNHLPPARWLTEALDVSSKNAILYSKPAKT
ncbi:hypothetical protein HJFPF1_00610 [Paramyrothecium foliicola]|nr:hypothetical protein HJFPF1_00610 [Paramyrothecium foliicola]